MGPRVPAASASQKAFRTAFIYLTLDGTVPAEHLRGIESLRKEWATRFSVLTDGAAVMNADLNPPGAALPSNPGVTPPVTTPRTLPPSIDEAVSWLRGRQLADGRWEDQAQTSQRDTAVSVQALAPFPAAALNVQNGGQWLGTSLSMNTDYLARKIEGLAGSGQDISGLVADLVSLRNTDGGWGSRSGYASNPADTALALEALAVAGYSNGTVLSAAVSFLKARQNEDGGWSAGAGPSIIQPTAAALSAFTAYRNSFIVEGEIARGIDWLLSKQNLDGGFGNSPSTVYETAAAYMTLRALGAAAQAADEALAYLLVKQTATGSWDESVFKTALAIRAAWQGQAVPDLAVSATDISFTPSSLSAVPADVQISANVRNQGSIAVPQATVALYYGDPSLGNLIGQQAVGFSAHSVTTVTFTTTVASEGLHEYFIVVDPENAVREGSELNNTAKRTIAVNIPQPTVGFIAASSSGLEGSGAVTLTVALSRSWHDPVTVTASIDPAGTATPSADFTGIVGLLTFYPGETTRTINLQVIDDALPEPDETIIVALTGPVNADLGQDRHTYTVIDNEAPSVQILSPFAGPVGTGTPLLEYVTSGGVAVVQVDGVVVNKQSGDLLGPLADGGPYAVRVEVTNAAGMTGFAEVSFTVDTSLPVVTITSPIAGLTNQRTPLLQYTVSLPSTVIVKVDGLVVNKQSGENLDALADGAHTVRVEATNTLGSTGYASVTFTVDATPPVVIINSPVEGVSSQTSPVLLYQISESASVIVRVDGAVVNMASGGLLGPFSAGEHIVRVEATDAGGSTGYGEVSFIIYTGIQAPYELTGQINLGSRTASTATADAEGNSYAVSYACTSSPPVYTMWVTKYDHAGKVIWESPLSSTSNQCVIPSSIAVDDEGSAYVALYSWGGVVNYGNVGYQDSFLIKYNNDGTFGWAQRPMATGASDFIYSVSIGQDGSIYVGGITGYGGVNAYWAKYDKTGAKTGGNKIALGTDNFSTISDVAADADGNVYIAGYTDGNLAGNASKYPNAGFEDYYVASYDKASILRWAHQGGTAFSDRVTGIALDAFGGIYLTGYTDGGLEGNVNQGQRDAFVTKFNSSGTRQWTRQLGTDSNDIANTIEVEKNGVLYLAGTTSGAFAGADGSGGIFVIKGDGSGSQFNQSWVKQFGTATGKGEDISLSTPGLLFVRAGNTLYTLRDPRLPAVALDHDTMWANTESHTITGTMSAGAQVQVTVDTGALASEVIYPTSTTWQSTVSGLIEGTNSITITAKNSGGFRSTISGTISRDSVFPTVMITSPWNWQAYYDKPVLEYSVSEGSVKVKINGVEVYKQSGHTLDSLSSGENTVRVEATDEAGNVGFAEVTIIAQGNAVGELPYVPSVPSQIGSTADDVATDSARDGTGNLYVTGHTFSALDGNVNAGVRDIFVAKYDSTGSNSGTAWQIGTSNSETDSRIAVDLSGNVYLAWQVIYVSPKNGNNSDIQVAKYDSTGKQAWIQTFGSKTHDYLGDIAVDSAGNVYVAGFTSGAIGNNTYGGGYDYYLVQHTSAGRQKWTVQSGLAGDEKINALALDQAGNIYVTGQMGTNPFVHKFSTAGAAQWSNHVILNAQHQGYGSAIAIDGQGNAVIAGSIDLGTGGLNDLFAAKYGPSGTAVWPAQYLGSGSPDDVRAVAIDPAGSIFIAGHTAAGFDGNRHSGGSDIFVAKFGAGGKKLWSQQYGTAADDYAASIVADGAGGVFLTGYTYGQMAGTTMGGSDIFIMKLQK